MRRRIGKWMFVWDGWLPRIVPYVNLGEWRRKSKYVDAACRAASITDGDIAKAQDMFRCKEYYDIPVDKQRYEALKKASKAADESQNGGS